jgi:octaprenyl-diphosphate synthase
MTATIHSLGGRRSSPSLDPIMSLVAADLNHVNAVILERMQSEVILIPELAGHLIAGGGKRMRPMLTLASARLLDYPGTRQHKLAAAVEFIHTATLLHDDVVDGSGLRRGKRTANIIWGNPASVLVGDFLFSRSFELMVEDGSLKVLKILSHASNIIAEGEVNQLTAQRQVDTSEDRYLDIISAKTAALFAAACKVSRGGGRARGAGGVGAGKLWPQPRHRLPAGRRCDRLCRDARPWARTRATTSATAR